MFKSTKTYLALVAAAVLLSNCSQNDDTLSSDNNKVEEQQSEEATIMFELRANTSTMTRSAEDSYVHEQGSPDEYKVNNARVYLFDSPTKLLVRSIELTDIKYQGSDPSGSGVIIYETGRISVPQGTYDVFVVANSKNRVISKGTEEEFLADIDSITYVRGSIEDISNGVLMTSRGSENLGIVVVNDPNRPKKENGVNVTLERALARIDVAKGSNTFELTDEVGTKYASVTLERFYIVNLPKYLYSFRHVGVLTSLTPPVWNVMENFGNIKDVNGYLIDPYFFKKTIDATAFRNADKYYEHFYGDYDAQTAVWTSLKNVTAAGPQYSTTYCLENAMLASAQKNGYSTGVVFSAKFEPNDNVYRKGTYDNLVKITDPSQYPDVLYYYNHNFYNSSDALAIAIGEAVTPASMDEHQVRIFEKKDDGNYRCYYTYWIRHLDNNRSTEMGVMEFAIVRNNLYRLCVARVTGLGDDTLVPDTDIPDEGETYLKVVLNVKPWIIRDQTNIVL
jgi:hypothetical protein